jgi:type I restriction enzyme R subunit
MPITPEDRARETIDRLLTTAGWVIQSRDETNINAARGVAIRQFPLKPGYGDARSRPVFSCRDQQALEILNA